MEWLAKTLLDAGTKMQKIVEDYQSKNTVCPFMEKERNEDQIKMDEIYLPKI